MRNLRRQTFRPYNTSALVKILVIILVSLSAVQAQTIKVDQSVSFQTMSGWETHAQSGEIDFPASFAVYGSALLDQAVEAGINRVRLEVPGVWENPGPFNRRVAANDDPDPYHYNAAGFRWSEFDTTVTKVVIPLRNRLMARNEALIVNLCYVDFMNNGGSFYHANNAAEYAELILAAFNRMKTNWGFVPDLVEIILEPDAGENPSRWTPAKIGYCLSATQSRLAAAGFNPRFIVPSTTSCPVADTWYNNFKAASRDVMQYVDELSYHRYQNCDAVLLAENRDAAQTDGNRLSMLEWWDPNNSYTTLHEDIGPSGNAVAWQGGIIAYPDQPDNGGPLFLVNSSKNSFVMSSRMRLYRQYFKWIRHGAVRKGTSNANSIFDGLAFRNPGGNYTVVVKCGMGGTVTIRGLPAGKYHVTYTTGSEYNKSGPDQTITAGQGISVGIPAAGVLTVFADPPSGSKT